MPRRRPGPVTAIPVAAATASRISPAASKALTRPPRRPRPGPARTGSPLESSEPARRDEERFQDSERAGGISGDPDVNRNVGGDAGQALAEQAAADRVGADGDDHPGVRHALIRRAQRADHAGRARAGDEQDVGVARARGEEDAEPVHVVDRAEQRLDFPLGAAVRARVHVPDVHAAAQRGGAGGEGGPGGGDGIAGLGGIGHDEGRPDERGRGWAGRAGRPGEQVGTRLNAATAQDAAALVDADAVGDRNGPGRAQPRDARADVGALARVRAGDRAGGRAGGGRAAPGFGVVVGAARPGGGHDAVAEAAQGPDAHSAAPATERPKLASMNGKSVRMSPAKTSCISTRLWNEAERGWQRAIAPPATVTSYSTSPWGASAQPVARPSGGWQGA